MKTITLYDNSLLFEADANVVNSIEENGKFWIELDKTIFYPEGGGMLRDTGTINDEEVLDLKNENGTILHLVNTNFIGKVHLKLDKDYRLRRIQCHSSQHLVSALFIKEFQIDTISAHYYQDGTTDIDIKTAELTLEQVNHVEKLANEAITEDIPVTISYLSAEEAKKYTPDIEEYAGVDHFRLVVIDKLDYNLCGCPHVPSLKYLKGVIITGFHKIKDFYKITITSGNTLIENAHRYYNDLLSVSNLLASKIDNVPESVKNLSNNYKEINNRLYNYKTKYLELYSSQIIAGLDLSKINIVLESHDDLEMKDMQFLVSKFSSIENVIIVGILKKNDGTSNVMIAKNKNLKVFSAKEVFKVLTTKYGYRGGGNDFIAQGGGKTFECMDASIKELVENSIK